MRAAPALLLALTALAATAQGQVYKCVGPDGKVTVQSIACPTTQQQSTLKLRNVHRDQDNALRQLKDTADYLSEQEANATRHREAKKRQELEERAQEEEKARLAARKEARCRALEKDARSAQEWEQTWNHPGLKAMERSRIERNRDAFFSECSGQVFDPKRR